jgi:ATP phosphoribosyltransferase
LERYLKQQQIEAEIHTIAGSVEIAPSVGMADAIFDIVSSGSTLVKNGLTERVKVMESEAVLIASPTMTPGKQAIIDQILFRFNAVERSRGMKYVLMNLPCDAVEKAAAILPGVKSPTILPLQQKGWCSMHVAINESDLWSKIESLKAIGAEDILVLSLEKMIP